MTKGEVVRLAVVFAVATDVMVELAIVDDMMRFFDWQLLSDIRAICIATGYSTVATLLY